MNNNDEEKKKMNLQDSERLKNDLMDTKTKQIYVFIKGKLDQCAHICWRFHEILMKEYEECVYVFCEYHAS